MFITFDGFLHSGSNSLKCKFFRANTVIIHLLRQVTTQPVWWSKPLHTASWIFISIQTIVELVPCIFKVKPTCFFQQFLNSLLIFTGENWTIPHTYTAYKQIQCMHKDTHTHFTGIHQTPSTQTGLHPHTYPPQYQLWHKCQRHQRWKLPLYVQEWKKR